MSRIARKKSSSNIYHIILRRVDQQVIFIDNEDYNRFLWTVETYRKKCNFILYAWCLMSNHIHLLIKESTAPISKFLQRIEVSFVYWYNLKYKRTGHLFQGRFMSEPVENESYFLSVVRYIHLNPVKAGICKTPGDYPYSSYAFYFRSNRYSDSDLIFGLIEKEKFDQFHLEKADDICLDIEENKTFRKTDEEICQLIRNVYGLENISQIQNLTIKQRTPIIEMMIKSGASLRQISRLSGISITIINEIKRSLNTMK